jgi:hypothetical protein
MRVLWIHGTESGKTAVARKIGGASALLIHPSMCTCAGLREMIKERETKVLILDDVDTLRRTDLFCQRRPTICGLPLSVMPDTVLVTATEKPNSYPNFVYASLPSTLTFVTSVCGGHIDDIFGGMKIMARAFRAFHNLRLMSLFFRLLTLERLARDNRLPLEVKMVIRDFMVPRRHQ